MKKFKQVIDFNGNCHVAALSLFDEEFSKVHPYCDVGILDLLNLL